MSAVGVEGKILAARVYEISANKCRAGNTSQSILLKAKLGPQRGYRKQGKRMILASTTPINRPNRPNPQAQPENKIKRKRLRNNTAIFAKP